MESSTIKEICDVVSTDVMKDVRTNLSEMKPHLIKEITEAVVIAINSKYEGVASQMQVNYEQLEERITKLETEISYLLYIKIRRVLLWIKICF